MRENKQFKNHVSKVFSFCMCVSKSLNYMYRNIFFLSVNVERPTVGRAPRSQYCALSNLQFTQCTATTWSALQAVTSGAKFRNSRNGLILKAIQKSLNHSTDWPCIKVKLLLLVSKVCILAYIGCRT